MINDGGDIGIARFERAMQWFSDHWPENVEWPPGVPRPAPACVREAAE
jgi:hypothetical protein